VRDNRPFRQLGFIDYPEARAIILLGLNNGTIEVPHSLSVVLRSLSAERERLETAKPEAMACFMYEHKDDEESKQQGPSGKSQE
jgi:hypothetical protein